MASQKKKQTKKTKSNRSAGKKKQQPIFLTILIAIALLFGGGGYFTFYLLTKNDGFEIIGEKDITLTVGEEYVEQGAKIISFGKDKSDSVKIISFGKDESDSDKIVDMVDTTKVGEYYIKYSSTDFRYKNVVRYRYIVVKEADE